MKLLSICLPTYNREAFLRRFLRNLTEEMDGIEDKIEFCISDNASIDGTEELVKSFSEVIGRGLKMRYRRSKCNKGFDKNLLAVLNMATGKYCWTVGDDDLFVKGAVKKLVKILERNPDRDYFILNASKHGKLLFECYPNYQTFSFIGCHVIRRSFFNRIKNHLPENSFGFLHFSMYFVSYNRDCKFKIINEPFVDLIGDGTLLSAVPLINILYHLSFLVNKLFDDKVLCREQWLYLVYELHSNRFMYYAGSMLLSKNEEELEECYKIINKINFEYPHDRVKLIVNILYKRRFIWSICRRLFKLYIILLNRYSLSKETTAREVNF